MAESNYSEMFARLERQVEMDRCRTFDHVKASMAIWMGSKWRETSGQLKLVEIECKRLGLPTRAHEFRKTHAYSEAAPTWRHEFVNVKGHSQSRFRDLRTGRFIRKA